MLTERINLDSSIRNQDLPKAILNSLPQEIVNDQLTPDRWNHIGDDEDLLVAIIKDRLAGIDGESLKVEAETIVRYLRSSKKADKMVKKIDVTVRNL